MSEEQLNQLWTISRENERNIAVLIANQRNMSEEVKSLKESNAALKTIVDRAIGAKTFAGIVGAFMGALFSAMVTWFCARAGR